MVASFRNIHCFIFSVIGSQDECDHYIKHADFLPLGMSHLYIYVCFRAKPSGAQRLLLALNSGTTPGSSWGSHRGPRDWSESAICKANFLPTVLSNIRNKWTSINYCLLQWLLGSKNLSAWYIQLGLWADLWKIIPFTALQKFLWALTGALPSIQLCLLSSVILFCGNKPFFYWWHLS